MVFTRIRGLTDLRAFARSRSRGAAGALIPRTPAGRFIWPPAELCQPRDLDSAWHLPIFIQASACRLCCQVTNRSVAEATAPGSSELLRAASAMPAATRNRHSQRSTAGRQHR